MWTEIKQVKCGHHTDSLDFKMNSMIPSLVVLILSMLSCTLAINGIHPIRPGVQLPGNNPRGEGN